MIPLAPSTTTTSSPDAILSPGYSPDYALKGEDHFVRVIGDAREELIFVRMRDAVEQLGKSGARASIAVGGCRMLASNR